MATDAPVRSGASLTMNGFFVRCSAMVTRPQPLGVAYPARVPTMTDTALAKPAIAPADLCTFLLPIVLATMLCRSLIVVKLQKCRRRRRRRQKCRQGDGDGERSS